MDFQTIYASQLPTEAQIIRSKLESEGYVVHLKDELTVQNYNFISNAVGGVKVQVEKSRALEAAQLLADLGYIMELPTEPDLTKFTGGLSSNTILLLFAVLVSLLVLIIWLLNP